MSRPSFLKTYDTSPAILTEGAIVERLRHEFHIPLDEQIVHAGLIYDIKHRNQIASVYRQYLDIAASSRLPILLMTPTRRVNPERLALSAHREKNVIADNVAFLKELRDGYTNPVYIGGLTGCRGDAYSPIRSYTIQQAFGFHLPTVQSFQKEAVDFLFAGIIPELNEAIGMAQAMETTGLPYIISFMIKRDGRLMDGTFIHDAIAEIDRQTSRQPVCYMANCVHPAILRQALNASQNNTSLVQNRFNGIQANAANLSPEELNACDCLHSSSATELADSLMTLLRVHPLKICGGCCGTDATHLRLFAELLSQHQK